MNITLTPTGFHVECSRRQRKDLLTACDIATDLYEICSKKLDTQEAINKLVVDVYVYFGSDDIDEWPEIWPVMNAFHEALGEMIDNLEWRYD